MTSIQQHIPPFVSGEELQTAVFHSMEELRQINFVKRIWINKKLSRFSVLPVPVRHGSNVVAHLIAERVNGTSWVVGYLDDVPDYLPSFKAAA